MNITTVNVAGVSALPGRRGKRDHVRQRPTRASRLRLLALSPDHRAVGLLAAARSASNGTAQTSDVVAQAVAVELEAARGDGSASKDSSFELESAHGGVNASKEYSFERATRSGFTPIDSKLTFGEPTDIAAGWDGSLWAIDAAGAPHTYDPVHNTWQLFGTGIDAACVVGGVPHFFRGGEVFVADGQHPTPRPIAQVWPNLPPSFKLGVQGAACVVDTLFLFRGGQYFQMSAAAPAPLTGLSGWPQTPTWKDGVIDAALSDGTNRVSLFRGAEFIVVDLSQRRVVQGPLPISQVPGWQDHLPPAWATSGIDAAYVLGRQFVVHRGAAVVAFEAASSGISPLQYVAAARADWPVTWNAVHVQAPRGRNGALWSATKAGAALFHDGTGWTVPGPPHRAACIDVGVDGSAISIGLGDRAGHNLYWWHPARPGHTGFWSIAGLGAAARLVQVTLGDGGRVWVRDEGNAVYRFVASRNYSQFIGEPLVPASTHITANADGTLWSCDGSQRRAFRFISEATRAPEPIDVDGIVLRVASTGFGTAHCLVRRDDARMQLYRYDSPYVFKTSQAYQMNPWLLGAQLEQGLGNLYFVQTDTGWPPFSIVAIDAQTGQEVSRSAPSGQAFYSQPVFDPIHELVYVGVANGTADDASGALLALDARDLRTVRWSFDRLRAVDGLTLQGTQLCFGDRGYALYMVDTVKAASNPQSPGDAFAWDFPLPNFCDASTFRMPPPVLADGVVHTAIWGKGDPGRARGGDVVRLWYACWSAADGAILSGAFVGEWVDSPAAVSFFNGAASKWPVLGKAVFDGGTQPALFVNAGRVVYAVNVENPQTSISYSLPDPTSEVISNLTYDAGNIWFGDTGCTLYGLDGRLAPLPHTPSQVGDPPSQAGAPRGSISTTPVVYTSTDGVKTVLFSAFDNSANPFCGLSAFDPTTGMVSSVPTSLTHITLLSKRVSHGVIYAAGVRAAGGASHPQVFGIRVDDLVQGLRNFIVESALMQDFDDASKPNGMARYQTHLTVVDDLKSPLPHETVKIWADQPTTVVIDGRRHDIGPGDNQCAAVRTGPDGTVTIASGYVKPDGTDKPDMFAPPLRVWASFMNRFERIMVYRDREFHNRLATAQVVVDERSPDYDDPDRVNLQATRTYAGTSLFTDEEKRQQQPGNIAAGIQTMTKSIGFGGAAGGGRNAAWVQQSTSTVSGTKYIPYTDLPGMTYSAVNTSIARPAVVLLPAGLVYASNDDNTAPISYWSLTPAQATAAIDSLGGEDWAGSVHAPPALRAAAQEGRAHVGSWWTDFWNWLKGVVAEVTHFIVSVAEDIYVGIRLIVSGIAYVFRQIIHVVEDVVSAIGTFFRKLAKLIEDVIEALSVLFHFDEIIKTQNFLLKELNDRLFGIEGNSAYPGVATAIKNTAIPKVDAFFEQGEHAISGSLNKLADQIVGTKIVELKGQQSTAHTVYTVKPKGGGPGTSHATQCSWALHKLKAGMPTGVGAMQHAQVAGDDPLSAFFSGFITRISNDGDLSSQWQKVKHGFQNLEHASSPHDFLTQGVAELLRALALLLDGVLAVSNAFLDGFLNAFASLIPTLFDPNTGWLTRPLEIPVLSWLYQKLFGRPLTVMNVITLVAAIPLTIVWRVAEGEWPSQSLAAAHETQLGVSVGVRLFTVFNGFARIIKGLVAAVHDATTGESVGPEITVLGGLRMFCGVMVTISSYALLSTDPPSDLAWVGFGVTLGTAIVGWVSCVAGAMDSAVVKYLASAVNSALGVVLVVVAAVAYDKKEPKASPADDLNLAAGVTSACAFIINPIKFVPDFGTFFVPVLDVILGFVAGALTFAVAAEAP